MHFKNLHYVNKTSRQLTACKTASLFKINIAADFYSKAFDGNQKR
jgi:hypothetical protein